MRHACRASAALSGRLERPPVNRRNQQQEAEQRNDWDAEIAKLYGFTEDLTNVYLIDEQGMLSYRACGKGAPEETRKLLDMIASMRQTK